MIKLTKISLIAVLALALVLGTGAGSAQAALTLGALSAASDGALTLTGAVGSAVNLGTTATTGAIAIGGAQTTGTITVGVATQTGNVVINGAVTGGANTLFNNSTTSTIAIGGALTTGTLTLGKSDQTAATTIYGGSTTNAIRLLPNVGTVGAGTDAHGVDVVASGTFSGGDNNLVGLNSVLTTAGTAGKWASGVYGKVVQGTTQNVTGYLSGGEFEVANSNTTGVMEMFPLVLDSNSSTYSHPDSAYIWAQDFGAAKIPNLLKITGATSGSGNMFYVHAPTTLAASLKIIVGTTTYYIPLYTTQ